jgi:hypothetical protein
VLVDHLVEIAEAEALLEGSEAHERVGDLLIGGEPFAELDEDRIGGFGLPPDGCRGGGDQARIGGVGLGRLPADPAIQPNLEGLMHDHLEPLHLQCRAQLPLIAARRLDADAADPVHHQPVDEPGDAGGIVAGLKLLGKTLDRCIETPFAHIDPGNGCARLAVFHRPLLAVRTQSACNHPGR